MKTWLNLLAGTCLIALAGQATASKEEDDWPAKDLIHSDVPLYGLGPNLWPKHFSDDDGSFGCTSRMSFGDWRLKLGEDDEVWWRVSNYGVFHCALIFRTASQSESLKQATYRYGFLVKLGTGKIKERPVELWAFQIGTVPGSDYVLLARAPSEDVIKTFIMLQRKCPANSVRSSPSLDIFGSSYCSINSKAELLSLARAMLKRPPLGHLDWVADLPKEPGE